MFFKVKLMLFNNEIPDIKDDVLEDNFIIDTGCTTSSLIDEYFNYDTLEKKCFSYYKKEQILEWNLNKLNIVKVLVNTSSKLIKYILKTHYI